MWPPVSAGTRFSPLHLSAGRCQAPRPPFVPRKSGKALNVYILSCRKARERGERCPCGRRGAVRREEKRPRARRPLPCTMHRIVLHVTFTLQRIHCAAHQTALRQAVGCCSQHCSQHGTVYVFTVKPVARRAGGAELGLMVRWVDGSVATGCVVVAVQCEMV